MPPFQLHFGAGFLCSPERLNMGTWALESSHGAKGSFEPIRDRLSYGTGRAPIVARCEIKSAV
jgi:hypothetical protein